MHVLYFLYSTIQEKLEKHLEAIRDRRESIQEGLDRLEALSASAEVTDFSSHSEYETQFFLRAAKILSEEPAVFVSLFLNNNAPKNNRSRRESCNF